MNINIYFDHSYTGDQNHAFLMQLKKYGFDVTDFLVKHPNSDCRFLYFGKGSYLEFIHCPDKNKDLKTPGISFGVKKDLKKLYEKYSQSGLACSYSHRNYNWHENNKDRLPGWNFIEFKNKGFRTFYPWFTEYEPNPNSKRKFTPVKHPNGVTGIFGHEFIINKAGRVFFERILETKIKDKITLKCGTSFYFKEGLTNYHSKVILESSNLKKTLSFMRKAQMVSFAGKDSILIKNPSPNYRMWDLLIF